ncbi:MAG: ATP-binding protein [Candidatus Riflebacteria bacterium]|nr:ATP-binding protein [Candidatus Riflebacteria bacterium]
MIKREAERFVRALARGFPIVAVTGPRQSGKTTLVKAVFPKKKYITLEDPDEYEFANSDPRRFLERFPDGAILDEIQRCQQLFSYLQSLVDADGRCGLFILTGSQQFGLLAKISQSLAGRVGLLQLLPFSLKELETGKKLINDLDRAILKGFYPPVHVRKISPANWYSSYMMTYIERDVRQVLQVRELGSFQKFVRLCASRTGQILNLSALGAECGITHNTAKAWISVLEASYILVLLHSFHRNFGKRLVKAPKLYFLDPGFAAWLIGLKDSEHLCIHSHRGALFETLVVSELIKTRWNYGLSHNLFYWRDHIGNEVDLIFEDGESVVPIEIKSGKTILDEAFRGLRHFRKISDEKSGAAFLIYGGEEEYHREEFTLLPWQKSRKSIS